MCACVGVGVVWLVHVFVYTAICAFVLLVLMVDGYDAVGKVVVVTMLVCW